MVKSFTKFETMHPSYSLKESPNQFLERNITYDLSWESKGYPSMTKVYIRSRLNQDLVMIHKAGILNGGLQEQAMAIRLKDENCFLIIKNCGSIHINKLYSIKILDEKILIFTNLGMPAYSPDVYLYYPDRD